jgi:hypothetical protein
MLPMLNRFCRIHREFGTSAVVRLSVLLIGLLGMALLGLIAFASAWATLVAAIGLALGVLLRQEIARGAKYYSRAIPASLFVYGIVLFLGERLGLDPEARLLIITATTVVVFDLQFWSLSDPSVVNTERRTQE